MAISNDVFIQNPVLLPKNDEAQIFDAIDYLKIFIDTLHSKRDELSPSKVEKVVYVFNTQIRIIGYSTLTGYLCTSLAKEITTLSSLSLANSVLKDVNTLISGTLYGLTAIQNGYQLAKDQNLRDLLKQNDALALQGLMQNLSNPISSHLDRLKTSWSTLDSKDQEFRKQRFKQEAQKSASDRLKSTHIQRSDLNQLLKSLQRQEGSDEVHQLLGLNDSYWQFTPLEALGLLINQHEIKTRQWVELKEASSLPVVQAVDKAYRRGLLERVNYGDRLVQGNAKIEMRKLMGRVRVESTKTKKIHTALLIINLLGAITSVIGVLTLPFGIGIAITALSFLVTTASIGMKAHLIKKEMADTPCGKYDKTLVIIAALLLGASLIALTGITLGFGLSLVQLGSALAAGGLGGSSALGYYYHLLTQKDILWKQAHPSLKIFQEFISNKKEWNQDVHDLFKKLPKDLRIAIRQQYVQRKDLPSNPSLRNQISALKKTSKYFWNRWLTSNLAEERVLALEVQSIYEEGQRKRKESQEGLIIKQEVLRERLEQIFIKNPQVKEQWEKDLKYVVYRKSSLSYLHKMSDIAAQNILKTSRSPTTRLAQSG